MLNSSQIPNDGIPNPQNFDTDLCMSSLCGHYNKKHLFQDFQSLLVYYNINRRGRGFKWGRWKQKLPQWLPAPRNWLAGQVFSSCLSLIGAIFFHDFLCSLSNKGKSLSCSPTVLFHSSTQETLVLASPPSCLTPFAAQKTSVAHTVLLSGWCHLSGACHLPQWTAVKQTSISRLPYLFATHFFFF